MKYLYLVLLSTRLLPGEDLLYAQFGSSGIAWDEPIQMSDPNSPQEEALPSLAVQGETVHITWGTSQRKCPYRRSTDGGMTFEPIRSLEADTATNQTDYSTLLASADRLNIFYIRNRQNEAWMRQSTDRGTTWSPPRLVADSAGSFLCQAQTGDTILLGLARAGDYRRIYRSTDAGVSWVATLPMLVGNTPNIAATPGVVHMVKGWVFDSSGVWSEFVTQYRKSTDLGDSWSDSVNLSSMDTRTYEPEIAADGSGDSATAFVGWRDTKYGCLTMVGCGVMGRRSLDGGSTFRTEQRLDSLPSGFATKVAVFRNTLAVAWRDDLPSYGSLIRVSQNRGTTWTAPFRVANGDMEQVQITQSAIHVVSFEPLSTPPNRYIVMYRRGRFLPDDVVENQGSHFARGPHLLQNYPNPFNPRTTISYRLNDDARVVLGIYDVLGREVVRLVNGQEPRGEHKVAWDAVGKASGIYYYRLAVHSRRESIVQTKKMMLIR
jgi:hypothetical protein